jgi:hypothetical protein
VQQSVQQAGLAGYLDSLPSVTMVELRRRLGPIADQVVAGQRVVVKDGHANLPLFMLVPLPEDAP